MAKMKSRKPLMAVPEDNAPSIYTYADSIKNVLEKGRITK